MIDIQSFNIYLKVGWIKRLFSNLDGDWQKVLLFNLQSYGGKRVLTFQKEKLKEAYKSFLERCSVQLSFCKTLYKDEY